MSGNELWIIYSLVFGAVLLGVRALYSLVLRSRVENRIVNRRLALSSEVSDPVQVLDLLRRERGLGGGLGPLGGVPALESLEKMVMQTGLQLTPTRLGIWAVGLIALFYVPLMVWLGIWLLPLVPAVLAALATGYILLRLARARRINRFSEQLPEALDIVVRGLRAGHPFRMAIGLVARELPDPIGTEFGILLDEITFGLDQQVAIEHLRARVGQEDLSFVSLAVNIQSQTGGNLAEILHGLARLLRSRSKMRLKIRALSSEGRLSGVFLSAMPFVLFLIINLISPSYFGYLKGSPLVAPALIVALSLLAIGNFVIYRMVNFRF
jgi:tight adherence protein B